MGSFICRDVEPFSVCPRSPGVQAEVGHSLAPAPVQGGQWSPASGPGSRGWSQARPRGGGPLPDFVIDSARVSHLNKQIGREMSSLPYIIFIEISERKGGRQK